MNLRNRIAFLCMASATLVELGIGVVYLLADEAMPYHKEVLGVEWSELEPGIRTMLVGLVNGYGGAHLTAGMALSILLLIPFRQGQAWARWALLATGLPVLASTAWASHHLAVVSGAGVPWKGALVLLLLFLTGIALARPAKLTQPAGNPPPG